MVDRYQVLFENSGEPILIIEDDRFVDCNQATVDMLGYADKQAVLRCHPSEISPEYQPDGMRSEDKANGILARVAEVPYQCFEWTHVRADGTLFPVEVALTAIPGKDGFTIHTTWRDISERKRLEKELRHAQKMDAVGKLAGGIAHDFNNQLVPIMGYAEMLSNALNEDQKLSEWAAEIHRSASLAAIMVEKLLSLSRKDDHKLTVRDLAGSVSELSAILRKLIGEDITLEVSGCNQPLWVKTNEGDIEQIVLNLVSNSRDALPQGGSIGIDMSLLQGNAGEFGCVEVTDDGCGMDAETLARIYEPFYTTKELGSGTGLGLSTVFDIVNKAGGEIKASSLPGKGTTIAVLLPIADSEDVAPMGEQLQKYDKEAVPDVSDRNHVFIVEDNARITRFIARILREHGFRVSDARNGREALRFLARETPDVILTDVIMDELSGPLMVRQLEESGTRVPVVFMSGHTDDRLTAAGFDVSKLDLLRKPFSADALVDQIRKSLAADTW